MRCFSTSSARKGSNPLLDRLQTPPEVPGLRLASVTDLAVMKWVALSSRGARKDFIDLYFIARTGLGVASLVPMLDKKYPGSDINLYHMVKSLSYFDDAENEAWPVMRTPVSWEKIKMYFQQQQRLLLDRYL